MPYEKNNVWWYLGMHRVKRLMLTPWTYEIPDLSIIGGKKQAPRPAAQPLQIQLKKSEEVNKPEQKPEFNNQPTLF